MSLPDVERVHTYVCPQFREQQELNEWFRNCRQFSRCYVLLSIYLQVVECPNVEKHGKCLIYLTPHDSPLPPAGVMFPQQSLVENQVCKIRLGYIHIVKLVMSQFQSWQFFRHYVGISDFDKKRNTLKHAKGALNVKWMLTERHTFDMSWKLWQLIKFALHMYVHKATRMSQSYDRCICNYVQHGRCHRLKSFVVCM
jgi:hypothetical protein